MTADQVFVLAVGLSIIAAPIIIVLVEIFTPKNS